MQKNYEFMRIHKNYFKHLVTKKRELVYMLQSKFFTGQNYFYLAKSVKVFFTAGFRQNYF